MAKQISIKSMSLQNFKGIKDLTVQFDSSVTNIMGANASGKTTLADAFSWCIFGKDSQGRSDQSFQIKTLDKEGNVIPKIEHTVSLELDVDGETVSLERTLKEKWVKKRGALDAEFTGNETTYKYQGVPMNKGDYQMRIARMIDEDSFKLLTDPHAFASLHWEKQRAILMEMAGEVTDLSVADGREEYQSLLGKIKDITIEEYRKALSAQRRKIKAELEAIPTRIDEVRKGMPEDDFDTIAKELSEVEKELKGIDELISDKEKAQESIDKSYQDLLSELFELQNQRTSRKNDIHIELSEKTGASRLQHQDLQNKKESLEHRLEALYEKQKLKTTLASDTSLALTGMRQKWNEINEEQYIQDEDELTCPSCMRPFDKETSEKKKDELIKQYNRRKKERLDEVNREGKVLKESYDKITADIVALQLEIEKAKEDIALVDRELDYLGPIVDKQTTQADFENALKRDETYQKLTRQIAAADSKLQDKPKVDFEDLRTRRSAAQDLFNELSMRYAQKDALQRAKQRIKDLSAEEKKLAQAMADLEREEYVAQQFTIDKVTRIEQAVNEQFEKVKFKLFEVQVNGAEVPTCKATFKGVDWPDVNSAGKIQAGIDIIKTLCLHYGAWPCLWIDNCESVTDIPATKNQQIRLYVSPEHKKLSVQPVKEKQAA